MFLIRRARDARRIRERENRIERLLQGYRRLERKSDPVTAAHPVMRLIEKPPILE
jgi:hypothetical protein